MSRKDTIIVAVLVNTGLLAILFLMAMHSDSEEVLETESHKEIVTRNEVKKPEQPSISYTHITTRDELDQVLQNYRATTEAPITINQSPSRETLDSREQESPYVEVTVKRGDCLGKIAHANGTTVSELRRINSLSSPRIDVGQVLKVPLVSKKEAPEQQPNTQEITEVEPRYYTIKSGDNPWKIAKQFNVRFDELLKMNHLDEKKARNLKPGDILRVK